MRSTAKESLFHHRLCDALLCIYAHLQCRLYVALSKWMDVYSSLEILPKQIYKGRGRQLIYRPSTLVSNMLITASPSQL